MNDGAPESFSVSVKPGLNDPLSIEQVEDILAPDGLFFGAEAVERLVGLPVPSHHLDRICPKTYTRKRALLAKDHKRALVLFVSKLPNGTATGVSLTPLRLHQFFLKHQKGDVFDFGPSGALDRALYEFLRNYQQSPNFEWREITSLPVPGTISHTALRSLDSLALYSVETTFSSAEDILPLYVAALREYDQARDMLECEFTDDLCVTPYGHTFIDHVSRLALTRLFIPTFSQLFYTMTLCRAAGAPFPPDPLVTSTLDASHQILSVSQTAKGVLPVLTSPLGLPRGAGMAFSQKLI